MSVNEPIIQLNKNEGTHVIAAGNQYRIIASGAETQNRFSVMETILEPGQEAPNHAHFFEDEPFYVLEGEIASFLDGHALTATEEDIVSCPPGVSRGFHNKTHRAVRMLLCYRSAELKEMTLRDGFIVEQGRKASSFETGCNIQRPSLAEYCGIKDTGDPNIAWEDPAREGAAHV